MILPWLFQTNNSMAEDDLWKLQNVTEFALAASVFTQCTGR